ncbi:VID27-domain-containing protein [Rhizopus microsporus ATCC 52813]|uniref:VID27-domain-containing protein n=1 Tax=Rhizopus microsporus ATCC 52813 TaxID=1340429 RepID=A0A2G4T6A6_RHIZD|nr:VID27-domain-containing protein [Rhizopus microsporus ATCC 52813]PHZ16550.1 VID27-domain-containing protein [Rhizopus microsporus ATCC 52813]
MFDILDRTLALPFFSERTKKEIIDLKYGYFSFYYNDGHRTVKQLLYKDAVLSIRRKELPYTYELVVSGTSEPGCPYENQQIFKVQKTMELQLYRINMNQDICFTWTIKECGESFEFVCNHAVSEEYTEVFMAVAYECIYEDEYKSGREFITDQKISAIYSPHLEKKICSEILKKRPESHSIFIPEDTNSSSTFVQYVPFKGNNPVHGTSLFVIEASFSLYRPDFRNYITIGKVLVKVTERGPFRYCLEIHGSYVPSIYQEVNCSMNPVFKHNEKSFSWNYSEDLRIYSFKIVPYDQEMYSGLKVLLSKAIFESASQYSFSRHKKNHQEFIVNAIAPNNIPLSSSKPKDMDEQVHVKKSDSGVCLAYDNKIEVPESPHDKVLFDQSSLGKDSIISVSQSSSLLLVTRGNNIGIYSQGFGQKISLSRLIQDVHDLDHKSPILPTHAMLFDQDSSYLMFDVNAKSNTVYKMDLKREQVVEEWKASTEDPLIGICPSSSSGNYNNLNTIVGITSNSIFRIDPRQKGINKISDCDYKKYSSKPEFSAVASSQSKYVAVGSQKGVIRLFDGLNTVATITLPPIGEPIIGLDVTPDGHYVVATCSNSLVFFRTSGNPQAVMLRILPEHITLMNEKVSFKRAYFDTKDENNIICTTGSFVVVWNFKQICKGNLSSYRMQRLDAPIITSASCSADQIVVAFDNRLIKLDKGPLL